MERVLVCAGRTLVDADGQPLHDGDMGAQVGQALDNLEAVLGEAGFALADVVRMNYFVTDVDAFLQAGDIYGARLAPGRQQAGDDPTRRLASRPPAAAGRDRGDRCEVAMSRTSGRR